MKNEAAASSDCILSARHVGLYYWLNQGMFRRRAYWALRDVTFDLYRGDSLGIIGKNGVGKSTLLRLLAGVMSPDKGEIIQHRPITMSLLAMNLGFIPYLIGRENAIIGGMFQGLTRKQAESKLDEIIAFAGLQDFIDQPISTYSSGMKARLGFAVAFQVQPDVLLIDEVLGVGDADFQERSMALMKERIKGQDTTIVFVSHSAMAVQSVCNRAVWIEDGQVQIEGKTKKVLTAYANFIASGEKLLA